MGSFATAVDHSVHNFIHLTPFITQTCSVSPLLLKNLDIRMCTIFVIYMMENTSFKSLSTVIAFIIFESETLASADILCSV